MDGTVTLLIVIAVVMFGIGLATPKKKRKGSRAQKQSTSEINAPEEYESELEGYPYLLRQNILTPAELNFYQSLKQVVDHRVVVLSKVNLGDLFMVNHRETNNIRGYRNKIDRKHVDFLICSAENMSPIVGIELDDSSHDRPDRIVRDIFVDGVFAAASLPLLHVTVKRAYSQNELAVLLAPYLLLNPSVVAAAKPAQSAPVPAARSSNPACPNCGSQMTLRTVKSGPKTGAQFWGCSTYPACRGMRPYSAESA